MFRALRTPRWLGFLALALAVAAGCWALGQWQLDRGDERAARNRLVEANIARPPVPVGDLLAVGTRPDAADQWRTVTAEGRYDPAATVLLRNRVVGGQPGFHVLVPLVTGDGPVLLVDRGWIPRTGNAMDATDVPPPPAGPVSITGRVRPGEDLGSPDGLGRSERPVLSVSRLDPVLIAADLGLEAYRGYVDVLTEDPPPPPASAPLVLTELPEIDPGPHLSYAFQWFAFGVIGLVGMVILLRREGATAVPPGPLAPPLPPTPVTDGDGRSPSRTDHAESVDPHVTTPRGPP